MPLQEFRIELDNPTASFFPSQNVTGRVIVSTLNEKSTQGLKIKLEGRAKVHWTERRTTTTNGKSNTVTVHYNATEVFIDFKVYVVGDGQSTVKIPPGRYIYPFNFQLPNMLPSSYVGAHGKVWYGLEATIKRSWKFDHEVKQPITVNAIVDLNTNPALAEPCQCRKEKHFCCLCCASGPVGFLIKLPTQGYVPGQNVAPIVEIYNQSSRTIKEVSVELIQNAAFFAQGRSKYSSKTIASATNSAGVGPGDTDIWQGKLLQIPSVPPSKLGGCNIIDVNYCLQFVAHVSGMAFNLKKSVPITIGTIPFRSAFPELSAEYEAAPFKPIYGGSLGLSPLPTAPSTFTEPSSEKLGYPSAPGMGGFMGPGAPAPSAPPVYNEVYIPPGDIKMGPPYPISSPTHTEIYNPPEGGKMDTPPYPQASSGHTEVYVPPGGDMKTSPPYPSGPSAPTEIYTPPGDDKKETTAPYPSGPSAPTEIYTPPGNDQKASSSTCPYPVAPKFYPGMPPMSFNTSIDFGGSEFEEQEEQDPLIASGDDANNMPTNTNKDNFVPNYVNYGWILPGKK